MPRLGGPSFTAIEQRTENARLVEVHFGVLSQVFVFPGSLGQFGHGTGGSDDSSGNLSAKSLFLTLTKYLPLCRRKLIPRQF